MEGYEKIEYDFTIMDGVFDVRNSELANCYKKWNRCLAVTDLNIYNVYGEQMEKYFEHYGLELVVHKTKIGEKAKTMPTLLSIVDSMNEFGIFRKVGTLTQTSFSACGLSYSRNHRNRSLLLAVDLSLMLLGKLRAVNNSKS